MSPSEGKTGYRITDEKYERHRQDTINHLPCLTTKELVDELSKREGVISITIGDYAYIAHGKKPSIKIEEPATILVIKE